jgi:hypothetical protein
VTRRERGGEKEWGGMKAEREDEEQKTGTLSGA